MTDTEQKRIKAICEVAHVDDISDLSDGYHTFKQLYYQRMMLFATLVKQNRDKAWKSLRHEDGELCFGGGWFIVGIDTPEGSYTYHCENKYFDLFDCEILDYGKHWDGHTEKDVIRLLSLEQEPCVVKTKDLSDDEIKEFVEEMKKVRVQVIPREPRWIPVSEALPKIQNYSDNYLVTLKRGGVHVAMFTECNGKHWWTYADVEAWMPLPEPYKAEGAEWVDDKCSVCGKGIEDLIDSREWYKNETPNYCPFCGERVVESEADE